MENWWGTLGGISAVSKSLLLGVLRVEEGLALPSLLGGACTLSTSVLAMAPVVISATSAGARVGGPEPASVAPASTLLPPSTVVGVAGGSRLVARAV